MTATAERQTMTAERFAQMPKTAPAPTPFGA